MQNNCWIIKLRICMPILRWFEWYNSRLTSHDWFDPHLLTLIPRFVNELTSLTGCCLSIFMSFFPKFFWMKSIRKVQHRTVHTTYNVHGLCCASEAPPSFVSLVYGVSDHKFIQKTVSVRLLNTRFHLIFYLLVLVRQNV